MRRWTSGRNSDGFQSSTINTTHHVVRRFKTLLDAAYTGPGAIAFTAYVSGSGLFTAVAGTMLLDYLRGAVSCRRSPDLSAARSVIEVRRSASDTGAQ
jgi:hypothetical protein